jgi:hypothetical protein
MAIRTSNQSIGFICMFRFSSSRRKPPSAYIRYLPADLKSRHRHILSQSSSIPQTHATRVRVTASMPVSNVAPAAGFQLPSVAGISHVALQHCCQHSARLFCGNLLMDCTCGRRLKLQRRLLYATVTSFDDTCCNIHE